MNINLKVWRQKNKERKGGFKAYRLQDIDPNISFLEMLDILNNKLIKQKLDPVAFDHDCREGICGSCGFMINGQPHGPQKPQQFVSFTCGLLIAKTKLFWNPLGQKLLKLLKISQ